MRSPSKKFFKFNLRKIPVILSNSVIQSLQNLKKVQNFKKSNTFKWGTLNGRKDICSFEMGHTIYYNREENEKMDWNSSPSWNLVKCGFFIFWCGYH
jgi:hypothetical protein